MKVAVAVSTFSPTAPVTISLRRYVTGPGTDQPIAMVGTGSSPTRDYFHTDRIGSVVAMTDNSGHVSQGPFTYDAYGQS